MQLLEEEMQEIIVTEGNLIRSLLETALTKIALRAKPTTRSVGPRRVAQWSGTVDTEDLKISLYTFQGFFQL